MPVVVGENSYVSTEEADAYFADRPRRAALWIAASPAEKTEALLYATEKLEQRRWRGTPMSNLQSLHWPARYYDSNGTFYADTPLAIRHATFELALAHLEDSLATAPEPGPAIASVEVGPIAVRFGGDLKPVERVNPWVERLIAPWISGSVAGRRLVRV